MNRKTFYVGTSGWHYSHWKNVFYPPEISDADWLHYYARHFNTLEINYTFYKLPKIEEIKNWFDCVPDDFVFAVKASRYITHMKKLSDTKRSTTEFINRVSILAEKLGPILFQLPPNWQFNKARLASFLSSLSPDFRYAFEFRNQSWHNDETYELLASHNASFCLFDMEGQTISKPITTDFAYIRLHGPGLPYRGSYSDSALSRWSQDMIDYLNNGIPVYCYFNNDQFGFALENARALTSKISAHFN